jgi:hypothetical protein
VPRHRGASPVSVSLDQGAPNKNAAQGTISGAAKFAVELRRTDEVTMAPPR